MNNIHVAVNNQPQIRQIRRLSAQIVEETYKIKDLTQVRLLADPLKLELLQAFAEGEKTTKQVAAELGESVTKLYRHVDALHDAGLLAIAHETQKRGTVERTFRAVAKRFEADHSLFADDTGEEGGGAFRDLLRAGEAEILDALQRASGEDDTDIIVTRLRIKGSPARIAELRERLAGWLDDVQACDEDEPGDVEEVGVLIAFYPLGGDQ